MSKKIKYIFSLSILILLFSGFLLLQNYTQISQPVVTHMNISGEADKFGDKINLVYALLANAGILAFILFFIWKPQFANYPFEITETTREPSYWKMQLFLAVLCIITSIAFNFMILKAIKETNLFLYLISFIMFVTIMIFRFNKNDFN